MWFSLSVVVDYLQKCSYHKCKSYKSGTHAGCKSTQELCKVDRTRRRSGLSLGTASASSHVIVRQANRDRSIRAWEQSQREKRRETTAKKSSAANESVQCKLQLRAECTAINCRSSDGFSNALTSLPTNTNASVRGLGLLTAHTRSTVRTTKSSSKQKPHTECTEFTFKCLFFHMHMRPISGSRLYVQLHFSRLFRFSIAQSQ